MLSRPATTSDGTSVWNLYVHSTLSGAPAALQWSFQASSSEIASFTIDTGPALTAFGKTVICSANSLGYNCLAVGPNANTIDSGVIAKLTVASSTAGIRPAIRITSPLAASAEGFSIPVRVSGDCRRTALTPVGK